MQNIRLLIDLLILPHLLTRPIDLLPLIHGVPVGMMRGVERGKEIGIGRERGKWRLIVRMRVIDIVVDDSRFITGHMGGYNEDGRSWVCL